MMSPHSKNVSAIVTLVVLVLLLGTVVFGVTAEGARPATPQQTLFVDRNDSSCSDASGAPYCTIQAAVDDAAAGDTVQVAAGVYPENVLIPSDSILTVSGVDAVSTVVNGGAAERVFRIFSSSAVTLTHLGITNGNFSLGGGVYAIQAELHLERSHLYANQAGSGAGLFAFDSDVTIRESAIFDNRASDDGGGIAVEGDGTLTLHDVGVQVNQANRGAGIYALDGSLNLEESEILDNTAVAGGGGIFRNKGYLGAFDSLIQGNVATTGEGGGVATDNDVTADTFLEISNTRVLSNRADGYGGGLYLGDGLTKSLTLQDSEISYNVTASDGGGIDVEEGLLIISDSVIHGNRAANDGGGGYVIIEAGNAAIQNTLISGNEAGEDGGGLFASAAAETRLDIDRSLLYDNQAGGGGGALFSDRTSLTASTIYSNTATAGGGVLVGDTFSGYNSTVSGNLGRDSGGGLYAGGYLDLNAMTIVSNTAVAGGGVEFDAASGADVQKTIIANNVATSDDGPDCRVASAVTSLGYNLVGIGNGCGGTFLDGQNGDQIGSFGDPLAPRVLPLADNGGYALPTNSVLPIYNAIPTHALTADSPAVDVIPVPTYCGIDQTDQRGVPRPGQDGDGDGGMDGDGCDVGAFERRGVLNLYLPFVVR